MKEIINKFLSTKIGQRNIKTALSVFVCLIIYEFLDGRNSIYACISAIICMQDSVETSVVQGKHRIIGTFLGGIIGVLYLCLFNFVETSAISSSLLIAMGITFVIHFCNVIDKTDTVSICCVVFIIIVLGYDKTNAFQYALNRTIDTLIGIIISIIINKYFDIHKIIKK